MGKPKKRRWIIIVAAVVVVAVAALFIWSSKVGKAQAQIAASLMYTTHTVERGSLEKTITASGALSSADTQVLTLPDGLLVQEVLVKAGDAVTKGQPLAELNALSVREQLAYLSKKAREEDNRLATASSDDSLVAPSKGRVKYQPVSEGDDVVEAMQKFGVLAILSADGWMRLDIETERTLPLGERMKVTWDGGADKGVVDRRTQTGYVILVPDDHAPYLGTATLMDGEAAVGSGTLTINMPVEVVGYDGVIRTVRYKLDESVPDGRQMYELKNAPVSVAFTSRFAARSKILTLYKQVIALAHDNLVLAPCDGVISELSIKKGEATGKTANADAYAVAATFATGGAKLLTINVDELDILSVVLGQSADVSMDALPNETLKAEVTRITQTGKKENSISTFPVELTMAESDRLLAGMNGTATIMVEHVENVLLVPLVAIEEDETGEFVYVLDAAGTRVRTKITTGRSNSEMAEVTEGLSEGDTVSYASASTGQNDMGMATTVAVG